MLNISAIKVGVDPVTQSCSFLKIVLKNQNIFKTNTRLVRGAGLKLQRCILRYGWAVGCDGPACEACVKKAHSLLRWCFVCMGASVMVDMV